MPIQSRSIQAVLSTTPNADRALELILVCVISAGAIGLISALLGIFYVGQIWLLAIASSALYWRYTSAALVTWRAKATFTHLLILLGVALFFRMTPFDYVRGGQDQGVYVNIANHLLHSGGVSVKDEVAQKLGGSSILGRYLASNRFSDHEYLLGIFTSPGSDVRLEFQFYDLFPVWMALVGGVLGGVNSVYALTIFSILSIFGAYRLVLSITGQSSAALLGGLLLATNPLHAFFSKFPVTEIPTLAFSLWAFAYLAEYCLASSGERRATLLWISSAALGSLFFVRISGFMYVPFVVALACGSALVDKDRERAMSLQFWALAVVAAYVLSIGYGLHWSGFYSRAIYQASFGLVFGDNWGLPVAICAALLAISWIACNFGSQTAVGSKLWRWGFAIPFRYMGFAVVVGVLLIVFVRVYKLGWTDSYSQDPWLAARWNLSGAHWSALKATSLAQLALYLGPFLMVLALMFLCIPGESQTLEYLRLVAISFFSYSTLLAWVIPYGPYYDRYLVSETLPFLTLFAVIRWSQSRGLARRAGVLFLWLSLGYSAVVSSAQIGKQEVAGFRSALAALVSRVGPHDVVLLDSVDSSPPDTNAVMTPLTYTFHKSVVAVTRADLHDASYISELAGKFDDVFLISPSATAPKGFSPIDSVRTDVEVFRWGFGPPRSLEQIESARLYLFHRDRPQLPLGSESAFVKGGEWNDWLKDGWSEPESWGVWANKPVARIEIDAGELPSSSRGISLHFRLKGFVSSQHPTQRAHVFVNGEDFTDLVAAYPSGLVDLYVPVSARELRQEGKVLVEFQFPDAIAPSSLGLGADSRQLSLGLLSVEAVLPSKASSTEYPTTRQSSSGL